VHWPFSMQYPDFYFHETQKSLIKMADDIAKFRSRLIPCFRSFCFNSQHIITSTLYCNMATWRDLSFICSNSLQVLRYNRHYPRTPSTFPSAPFSMVYKKTFHSYYVGL
jgi:hypothetical protein